MSHSHAARPEELPPTSFAAAGAAEFPNDNPLIHRGSRWFASRLGVPARAHLERLAQLTPPPQTVSPREPVRPPAASVAPPRALPPVAPCDLDEEPSPLTPCDLDEEPSPLTLRALELAARIADLALEDALAERSEAREEDALAERSEAVAVEPAGAHAVAAPTPESVAGAHAAHQRSSGAKLVERPSVAGAQGQPSSTTKHFEAYLAAVTQVALNAGATRAAIVFRELVEQGRSDGAGLSEGIVAALLNDGHVVRSGPRLLASDSFTARVVSWKRLLDGSCTEFQSSPVTLDTWTGAVLACLLGYAADRQGKLKRELRKQGVAAFGMRRAA